MHRMCNIETTAHITHQNERERARLRSKWKKKEREKKNKLHISSMRWDERQDDGGDFHNIMVNEKERETNSSNPSTPVCMRELCGWH